MEIVDQLKKAGDCVDYNMAKSAYQHYLSDVNQITDPVYAQDYIKREFQA